MIITTPIPVAFYTAPSRGANVIVANSGANPLNVAFDYNLCQEGSGIQLASGSATTQFFVKPGQTIFVSAPIGVTQANVMAS